MKKIVLLLILLLPGLSLTARKETVTGPDGRLAVTVSDDGGVLRYSVAYDGAELLAPSPLGLKTDVGDYTEGLTLKDFSVTAVADDYSVPTIKASTVHYRANRGVFAFEKDGKPAIDLIFQVSGNDVAFRYQVYAPRPDTKVCRVWEEATGYVFPSGTTTFLSPQMPPMAGFARTTPSYETPYAGDGEPGANGDGFGYVFPALFRVGEQGWVLVSETGVNSRYCGGRLVGNPDGSYRLAYPLAEEYNGNGTVAPGIPVPGCTPWRTLTVGTTLKPVVETTVAWDVVEPLYEPSVAYRGSKGSWSWIIKMDGSTVYPVQREYIDFSAAMGWDTVLVDALWDTQIGRENMEKLAAYAREKGVRLFVWYNSNGYWNDAPQGPRGIMDNLIARRREMAWLRDIGAKGIKVDFFGSDKQVALQLYEEILADANDFGLQVVFHGCTLPRGWERMYPNFASAEAVLASENLYFSQHRCDTEAQQAAMHPFLRNAVASMDFGGSALNKVYNGTNDVSQRGNVRRTSDVFALATAVLFQSSVQHFALAPNNLTDAPAWAVGFMKSVPTQWDEVRFIDGYPGRFAILARRSGSTWYIAGINASQAPLTLSLDLPMLTPGAYTLYTDEPLTPSRRRSASASRARRSASGTLSSAPGPATPSGSSAQPATGVASSALSAGPATTADSFPSRQESRTYAKGPVQVTIPCNGAFVIVQ